MPTKMGGSRAQHPVSPPKIKRRQQWSKIMRKLQPRPPLRMRLQKHKSKFSDPVQFCFIPWHCFINLTRDCRSAIWSFSANDFSVKTFQDTYGQIKASARNKEEDLCHWYKVVIFQNTFHVVYYCLRPK